MSRLYTLVPLVAVVIAAACGAEPATEESDRDLSLAPAESVMALNDQPADPPEGEPEAPVAPAPTRTIGARPAATPPERAPEPEPEPEPEPVFPRLPAGTGVLAFAADTLTSRHNEVGQPAMATVGEDIAGPGGEVVIPAGAVLLGTISDLAPAETPGGEGRMMLTFTRVEFGGQSYEINLAADSLGSRMKGRGVTAGDAAKVGAGAVVGAIAGRVIGGNRTGTAVGAAAGAAAGVGIAAATRDVDIILDAGAPIFLTIAADFELRPLN